MRRSSAVTETHLSLAAGLLPEFDAAVVARTAAEAGFSHAGFTIPPATWTPQMTREVRQQIAATAIGVLDVEVVWIPAGAELTDAHRMIIDVGAELGAKNVLVVSSEADCQQNAAALHQLCEWAAPAGMCVCLEFLMITEVRTLSAALAVVQACDHPAAAILIDSLHLQRAGEGIDGVAAVDPHLLPYAQLCDGNLTCDDSYEAYLEDAIDLRAAPGEGELPLQTLLGMLPEHCPLSLEVRSRVYRERYPDPLARATAVLQQTQAFLRTC